MTLDISFPLEFIVHGIPVSSQASRATSKTAWKHAIRAASAAVLPEGHFCSAGRMAVTLYYFPGQPMQGDIDNIVKPILDALSRHVYLDDRQVERLVVQKFEPKETFNFSEPSDTLSEAMNGAKPVLYIRISNNPTEELI
jgi:Holliday junction resolvase RusA-like endonuclease